MYLEPFFILCIFISSLWFGFEALLFWEMFLCIGQTMFSKEEGNWKWIKMPMFEKKNFFNICPGLLLVLNAPRSGNFSVKIIYLLFSTFPSFFITFILGPALPSQDIQRSGHSGYNTVVEPYQLLCYWSNFEKLLPAGWFVFRSWRYDFHTAKQLMI